MENVKVWLITGAGRGMGASFTRAVLDGGHAVVATGRRPGEIADAVGASDRLLVSAVDVTNVDECSAAAAGAVERFGRIDVLVNNAGNFNAGFFEELASEEFRAQIETTLFGPVNVTRGPFQSCAASAPGLSSRSPRPPALWAESS